jgi:hypothetical protein
MITQLQLRFHTEITENHGDSRRRFGCAARDERCVSYVILCGSLRSPRGPFRRIAILGFHASALLAGFA